MSQKSKKCKSGICPELGMAELSLDYLIKPTLNHLTAASHLAAAAGYPHKIPSYMSSYLDGYNRQGSGYCNPEAGSMHHLNTTAAAMVAHQCLGGGGGQPYSQGASTLIPTSSHFQIPYPQQFRGPEATRSAMAHENCWGQTLATSSNFGRESTFRQDESATNTETSNFLQRQSYINSIFDPSKRDAAFRNQVGRGGEFAPTAYDFQFPKALSTASRFSRAFFGSKNSSSTEPSSEQLNGVSESRVASYPERFTSECYSTTPDAAYPHGQQRSNFGQSFDNPYPTNPQLFQQQQNHQQQQPAENTPTTASKMAAAVAYISAAARAEHVDPIPPSVPPPVMY